MAETGEDVPIQIKVKGPNGDVLTFSTLIICF